MYLLTPDEGRLALTAARIYTETAVIDDASSPDTPFPAIFSELLGVFVTLTKNGTLRGCIGYPYPVLPLKDALKDAAVHAALHDPRFPAVTPEELGEIRIEVTILSKPEPLTCPAAVRPSQITVGRHGLTAQLGGRSGLLLPQVATEYNWTAEEFLNQACIKAGLRPDTWKNDECIIKTFEGQLFTEEK